MKRNMFNIVALFLVISIYIPNSVFSQIPSLSPAMLSQFTNMSSFEKRALADQYGIDIQELEGLSDFGVEESLGVAGDEISSDSSEVLIQRIMNTQSNEDKLEEYIKENTPIFDSDYSSIYDLPIYGQFLFDGSFSTFAPIDNAPVPKDYVVGTGDALKILMFGTKDLEIDLIVNREGDINFPELGNINVAGMTFPEMNKYIKNRVSEQMIGVNINISIGRLRSINVFMSGEAKVPGTYSISGLSSVSQLLYVAGGITDIGSLRDIQIRRSNKIIATFDLYKLLTEGDTEGDILLQSGDVVFIPSIEKSVYIEGAVRRPGRYELRDGEVISDLIRLVGGFQNRAYMKQVYIERYNSKTDIPSIINLDLTEPDNLKYELDDGDIIRIAAISDRLSNSVTLEGAIKRPGKYGWFKGIRFTDIISSVNVDFSSNIDINTGLIVRRKNNNNYDIEVKHFNIENALANPQSKLDPILENHDQILIFSLGHNDDLLNDYEVYLSKNDMSHPSYNENENVLLEPEIQTELTSQNARFPTSEMTDEDLRIELYEREKGVEYHFLNKGKRRVLLEPLIKKLRQQSTSLESLQVVSISGSVKVPGDYPLIKNATYSDLIELAGGYSEDAYIESAEIRRELTKDLGSVIIETVDIDLTKNFNSKLASRDHLHVRSIKDWDSRDSVQLIGEVFYPGTYLISPNEKLSSIIKRAGGFTPESFIEGTVFTRQSIKEKEREQLRTLGDTIRRDQAARSMTKEAEDFSVSSNEVEAGIEALLSTEVYGRLIIDVPSLMGGDISSDIIVQDGDVLTIPKFTNAVTVVGEVRRAGSFVRQDSYTIDDYLELAAGMTARSDKKQIYIIRADGSVEKGVKQKSFLSFENSGDLILAGDTIVVPIKSSYQTPLNLYSTVSQVIFQSIASIAAFSTVIK